MEEDAFNNTMPENNLVRNKNEDPRNTSDLLEEEQAYFHQIRRYAVVESLILMLLTLVVTFTLTYLLNATVVSRTDFLFYIVSMLIIPSGIFLLFLHFYDLYAIFFHEKKVLPLILDLFYFFCVPFFIATIFSLEYLYTRYGIPSTFLTTGWMIAVALLFIEVMVLFGLCSVLVKRIVAPHFPLLFPVSPSIRRKKFVLPVPQKKPVKQVFYFRKKSDTTTWETNECFVRYEK